MRVQDKRLSGLIKATLFELRRLAKERADRECPLPQCHTPTDTERVDAIAAILAAAIARKPSDWHFVEKIKDAELIAIHRLANRI